MHRCFILFPPSAHSPRRHYQVLAGVDYSYYYYCYYYYLLTIADLPYTTVL